MINEKPICHRAEDLVAYLYDEATETDAKDFADHAAHCDACRLELREFRLMRESLVTWRNEALGTTFSPAAPSAISVAAPREFVQHERKLTALQALREFFNVSPLWLRGATALAAALLCVLAIVVVTRSVKPPAPIANRSTEEKVYTAKELKEAVARAVNDKRVDDKGNQSDKLSEPQTVADNKSGADLNSPRRGVRRELASNSAPSRSRHIRGLTRAERFQLAADLRLVPGREETDLPFIFSDEPN